MRLAALKTYWPFAMRADVDADAEERLPSAPQSMALSDVAKPCPAVRPENMSSHAVLKGLPKPCPSSLSTHPVQNAGQRAVKPSQPSTCRRRKLPPIVSLCGHEEPTEAQVQAAYLLYEMADEFPELVRRPLTREDLEKSYNDLVYFKGWENQGWMRIAVAIKEWTTAQRRTKRGKKHTCYILPRITPELKARAALAARLKLHDAA